LITEWKRKTLVQLIPSGWGERRPMAMCPPLCGRAAPKFLRAWSPRPRRAASSHPCGLAGLARPCDARESRENTSGMFGRAPAPAPRAAPAGALPNGGNCTGSGCGAGAGAPRGFQRGGGVTFWWLHLAPTRNPPKELFCQIFFKTTQLHQRSQSRSRFWRSQSPAKQTLDSRSQLLQIKPVLASLYPSRSAALDCIAGGDDAESAIPFKIISTNVIIIKLNNAPTLTDAGLAAGRQHSPVRRAPYGM
jgi:hypothetical protein